MQSEGWREAPTIEAVKDHLALLRSEWRKQVIPSSAQEVMDVIDLYLDQLSDLMAERDKQTVPAAPAAWPTFKEPMK